jgi:cellulase/cellobiase CelA1
MFKDPITLLPTIKQSLQHYTTNIHQTMGSIFTTAKKCCPNPSMIAEIIPPAHGCLLIVEACLSQKATNASQQLAWRISKHIADTKHYNIATVWQVTNKESDGMGWVQIQVVYAQSGTLLSP